MNNTDKKHLMKFCRAFWFAPSDVLLRAKEERIWRDRKFDSPVLDIGCGDARISKLLFWNKQKMDVGLDANKKEIRNARATKFYKKVVASDAASMPFKRAQFNTVISNSTFEHIENDEKAVSEISRVLKKGGNFYFTTTTDRLRKTFKKIFSNSKSFESYNDRVQHLHYRSLNEWKKILKKNKLNIVDYKYYFDKDEMNLLIKLFKLTTFRPYKRELWSYLKDSPYGKIFPPKLMSYILYKFLLKNDKRLYAKTGKWIYIKAVKQ